MELFRTDSLFPFWFLISNTKLTDTHCTVYMKRIAIILICGFNALQRLTCRDWSQNKGREEREVVHGGDEQLLLMIRTRLLELELAWFGLQLSQGSQQDVFRRNNKQRPASEPRMIYCRSGPGSLYSADLSPITRDFSPPQKADEIFRQHHLLSVCDNQHVMRGEFCHAGKSLLPNHCFVTHRSSAHLRHANRRFDLPYVFILQLIQFDTSDIEVCHCNNEIVFSSSWGFYGAWADKTGCFHLQNGNVMFKTWCLLSPTEFACLFKIDKIPQQKTSKLIKVVKKSTEIYIKSFVLQVLQ